MSKFSKVVIVGGGAAGWLSALYANKISPTSDITVIESESIGILGAGEGSVPTLTSFLQFLEINEKEFIKETNATHKLGIMFENWNGDNKDYFHSFNTIHQKFNYAYDDDGEIVNAYTGYLYQHNLPFVLGEITEQIARANKSPFVKNVIDGTNQVANYSYHFDAHLVAKYLRKIAEKRGVKRVEGIVENFTQDSQGNVTEIILKDNKVSCTFVFDCSGFKRLLIGKLFNSPWKSYANHLKVNTALAFQLPQFEDKIEPYTKGICMKNGWMWQIPLQNRIGCGYVFDSNYITEEEAELEIQELLGHPVTIVNRIKFNAGAYEKVWINNCLAIGLSSAFTEPIEATSIFSSINSLWGLNKSHFDNYNQNFIDQYNTFIRKMNDDVLDFLYFHYLTKRNDSKFWQEYKSTTIVPKTLNDLLQLWNQKPLTTQQLQKHPFGLHSWLQVGFGLDYFEKQSYIKEYKNTNPIRISQHLNYLKHWNKILIDDAYDEKQYITK
jgi:tryptophan halogenase